MKLSIGAKKEKIDYTDHFDKIIENELLLSQANEELKNVHNILDNLSVWVKDGSILHYEHILPDIVMPNSMVGIDKSKFKIYVEHELLEKVKKILRKVAHFIFGSSIDSIDYLKDELSYLERIKKSLQMYHKMFTNEENRFDKYSILKKKVLVWSHKITEEKTQNIKLLMNLLETILQKDKAIKKEDFDIKKFNDILLHLGYTYNRDKKKVEVDEKHTFPIEKMIVEDLKWDYSKIKNQVSFLLTVFESRKVFDKLIDKLEDIKTSSKNVDNALDSIKDNETAEKVQDQVYDLRDEIIFLGSVKKVIMKHLHTLSHQLFILIKNMMKND